MAQKKNYHVSRIGHEQSDWERGIAFYQDDLKILEHRLQEISQMYNNVEVKSNIEHYQNQFIIQQNNLSVLSKRMKDHAHHIHQDVHEHAQHLTEETIAEHDALKEDYLTLEKSILELRHDFYRFLSHYM